MTKLFKSFMVVSLALIASVLLVGCTQSDGLVLFERAITQNLEVSNSLDQVAETDLSEASVTQLSLELQEARVNTLAWDTELTPLEKVQQIRVLHQEIVETHTGIVEQRNANGISFETLKSTIDAFKTQSASLSDEDRATVEAWRLELQEIKLTMQATIGKAYAQMRELRGMYTIENVDLILSTYQEVLDVLHIRLESIQRVGVILTDANNLLNTYME